MCAAEGIMKQETKRQDKEVRLREEPRGLLREDCGILRITHFRDLRQTLIPQTFC